MQESSADRNAVEVLAEEFLDRYRDGDRPPVSEYTARYPDLADEIEDLFPALLMMEDLKPAEEDELAGESVASAPALEQLGDYRIIREVGRGGMGVVYEAEQVSLGRRVALKVLPQQLVAGTKQRRRFEREAKAAARLHHTNIVPVFGVGEDDGLHYYVMQFIQGLGLDEVLEELKRQRNHSPKSLPATGIELPMSRRQDASAADIARSLMKGGFQAVATNESGDGQPQALDRFDETIGLEGRIQEPGERSKGAETVADLKTRSVSDTVSSSGSISLPGRANSEVTTKRQRQFSYWESVANIGVQVSSALQYAHDQGVQHRDIKPGNLLLDMRGTIWVTDFGLAKADDQQNITHTGDILGTLRYMPPESFEGKTDERSDIYSLGLTLYEMLAMQPAFDQCERNRLIKQVTQESPQRLNRLNADIPRDLVTVIHKAIEREPADRYQSGKEFAEDLQRFIEDEPVHARRISTIERFSRWSRRNKELAASLTTIACLLLVGFIGSALAASHFRRQEAEQRSLADDNGRLARQRAEALAASEKARRTAATKTYRALVGNARALRLSRQPGYRRETWSLLEQALAIDTSEKDIHVLRMEAAACLGDFMGTEPIVHDGLQLDYTPVISVFPDSRHIAMVNTERRVSIRTIDSNREVSVLQTELPAKDPVAMDIAPDGQRLIVLSRSGEVESWDREAGNSWERSGQYSIPSVEGGRYKFIRFLPEGRRFLVVSRRKVWVCELDSNEAPSSFDVQDVSGSPSLSPNGLLLACLKQGGFRVWNVETGKLEHDIKTPIGGLTSVAFTPDGQSLFAAGLGIVAYDTKDFTQESVHRWENSFGLSFTSDSRFVAFGTLSKKIRLWSVDAMREVATFDDPNGFFDDPITFSPDGRWLISTNSTDNRIWQLKGLAEKRTLVGHGRHVPKNTFSHDGKLVATASKDGTAKLWEVKTGRLLRTFRLKGSGEAVAFSPDDRLLAAGVLGSGMLTIWDVQNGRQLDQVKTGAGINDLAFLPDGKTLLAAVMRPGLEVYDLSRATEDSQLTLSLSDPDFVGEAMQLPFRISVSRSGERVAFSTRTRWGRGFYVWDVKNDQRFGSALSAGLLQAYHNISFLPDNRHVIFIAKENGKPEVWDALTGAKAYEISDTRRGLSFHSALSPDGRWLATDATAEAVTIIDVENKRELFTLGKERAPVRGISWSPDGKKIAIGLADGGVAIWDFAEVRRQLSEIGLDWQ